MKYLHPTICILMLFGCLNAGDLIKFNDQDNSQPEASPPPTKQKKVETPEYILDFREEVKDLECEELLDLEDSFIEERLEKRKKKENDEELQYIQSLLDELFRLIKRKGC